MSQTLRFIERLENLKEGERSRLRRLAGQPLDKTLQGFDLFTGLWWPLRQQSPVAPRRETSWLVAKLYARFPIPHTQGQTLASLVGRLEPRHERNQPRFRQRFDALLCSALSGVEPHLGWALDVIAEAGGKKQLSGAGVDWVQLLDDLSIWDRGGEHRRERDVRDIWAEQYLNATNHAKGANHAD